MFDWDFSSTADTIVGVGLLLVLAAVVIVIV
jgi:hypothetical protein